MIRNNPDFLAILAILLLIPALWCVDTMRQNRGSKLIKIEHPTFRIDHERIRKDIRRAFLSEAI